MSDVLPQAANGCNIKFTESDPKFKFPPFPSPTFPALLRKSGLPKINAEHFDRLRQRKLWLGERIVAKRKVGWDTQYDESEHAALSAALAALCS